MKRNEIVEKLIKEGFSEKTLVKFTDKQLSDLSSRILGESITNVASTDVKTQDELRKKKFKIDLNNPEYMFENSNGYSRSEFEKYKQWDKLIKKIMSI